MKPWIPLSLIGLTLAGCGTTPAASLASAPMQAPPVPLQAPQAPAAIAPTQAPTVTKLATPAQEAAASAADAQDLLAPGEATDVLGTVARAAALPDGPTTPITLRETDAAGRAYSASDLNTSSFYSDPIWLSPSYFPVLVPGHAADLQLFTPHQLDTYSVPQDAFLELGRLGRLRQRKPHFLSFLFGYGYPGIDGATGRSLVNAGQTIYLAPDSSRLHLARTYLPETKAAPLDAMLPALQADALAKARAAAREADITDRMKLLPGFNGSYDVVQFMLFELVVDGYTYQGSGVRRGLITAANLYEFASVKRAIATYWEDHPTCTAQQLRAATQSAMLDKVRQIGQEAGSLAAMPSSYADARAIPALRSPRQVQNGDSSLHDLDVQYNLNAVRSLVGTLPAELTRALYP